MNRKGVDGEGEGDGSGQFAAPSQLDTPSQLGTPSQLDTYGGSDEPIQDMISRVRARAAGASDAADWQHRPLRRGRQHSERRRTWRLVAMGIAVVALGSAWIGVDVFDETQSRTAQRDGPSLADERREVAPPPSTVSEALAGRRRRERALGQLPPTVRSQCRDAPGLSLTGSAVVCSLTSGVTLELRWFERAEQVQAGLRERLRPLRSELARQCVAARAVPAAPRRWVDHGSPVVRGMFACGHSARGAELVWSIDTPAVVGVLVRSDGDVGAALRWWNATTVLA